MEEGRRFEGRKAAVTGAGGFIGSAVCARLVAEGAEVVGLELDAATAPRVQESGAAFEACDVTDRAAVERGLEGAELVVNTAAHVREWGTMADFVRVNVEGTRNVLGAAERHGAERVLHVSSVVVYGYDHPGEQPEDVFHRTYGIPYIDTKSASDALACRRGAIVIRPGDVYGPRSVPWVLRPLQLARAGRLAVPGGGDGIMLPLYIDDLVEAVALGLAWGEPGRPYAVWSGEEVTFEHYFNRFAEMVGGRRTRRLPRTALALSAALMEAVAALRGAPPAFTRNAITFVDRRGTVSSERIRSELGWEPRVDLDEGMRRVERWAREEGLL